MFYRLIQEKRDRWFASPQCTVLSLVDYVCRRGMMRDAQIEAIKTYLYLKIACKGKPLWQLFAEGTFNNTDVDAEEINSEARDTMMSRPAALALYQYSRLKDRNGRQLAPDLEQFIRRHAREIDYEGVLRQIFYGVSYADYLFSLPMGAGKTFLMAAFIYIDLYFAQTEPSNPVWAHNFLVLAPSGLKSSIVPSLRSIRDFDPSWIFPEATAASLRRIVSFEVLDEQKGGKNSNTIKNPNAQKINQYQPDMMGVVAVTNAEKVILDRIDDNGKDWDLFSPEEQRRITVANELREVIGRVPSLAIFIDEVHHASSDEIKLRQVVTGWANGNASFCNVLGFSGTPYLEKAEKVVLGGGFNVRNTNITNVVYYYPLVSGIDNFLKRPLVKFADNSMCDIVANGVGEFLDRFKDTVYADGTKAKLAIYCGQIPTLEEEVWPLVCDIAARYGLNPSEAVLKRHKGSTAKKAGTKGYPEPEGSEAAFAMLDSPMSPVRIVLLVQIGKEGWDCHSLAGVILPHEGACPKNMVLQTSCRCLRQTARGTHDDALIWMNKWNADKLNKELKQQQNITLQEFSDRPQRRLAHIERHSRMDRMKVPPISFFQLKVEYETVTVDEQPDTAARLADPSLVVRADGKVATVQDMNGRVVDYQQLLREEGETLSYRWWLRKIVRESMGTLSMSALAQFDTLLRDIFLRITIADGGEDSEYRRENPEFDQQLTRSNIRRAFVPRRDFKVVEEVVPDTASILSVEQPQPLDVEDDSRFYPPQDDVKAILQWDADPTKGQIPAEVMAVVEQMRRLGMSEEQVQTIMRNSHVESDPHPERARTYHYLPYRFDSSLELDYFVNALVPLLKERGLEFYFNGDESLTGFKIRCYRREGSHWRYDGQYVPDFLVLSRDGSGGIDRICIIETKGEGFAPKFRDRLEFMQKVFVPKNNEAFHRERFRFLYVEDSLPKDKRIEATMRMLADFFATEK